MYYAQNYTTRWHDADAGGILRPSAWLMYMQETANLQCRDWGMDLDTLYRDEGLGFLLSRLMVRIDRPILAYQDIEVRTWCGESKGMTFLRCFSIHQGEECVATAISHWALMDTRSHRLMRVSKFQREFPIADLPDEDTLPRKVRIPTTLPMEEVGQRPIRYSDLDFNRHMNNTRYPDMVCDHLPSMEGRWVRSLSLSYLREAALGDVLTVYRTQAEDQENTYLVRTVRTDGAVNLEAQVELGTV